MSDAAVIENPPAWRPLLPLRPFRYAMGKTLFLLEDLLHWKTGAAKGIKGNEFLNGTYAPGEELGPLQDLEVVGALPAGLEGAFVRNGPNPQFAPRGGYHWFDGDGMLHTVRIKGGKAQYACRYIKTTRFKQEKLWGRPAYMKIGDLVGASMLPHLLLKGLKALFRVAPGGVRGDKMGTGNTALEYHDGRLLALNEGDHPYVAKVLCNGVIETVGRIIYSKEVEGTPFTAHPKVDPVNGEMCSFGYMLDKKPYVRSYVVSPDSKVKAVVDVDTPHPVMMHDGQLTQKFIVVLCPPLLFSPKDGVKNGTLPFVFQKDLGTRIGLLPRDPAKHSDKDIMWFDLPGCMIFHTNCAWDEGDEVVMVACRYEDFDFNFKALDSSSPRAHLYEFRLNVATGAASQKRLGTCDGVDFPRSHPALTSLPTQYTYMAAYVDGKVTACVKFDLKEGREAGRAELGAGRTGGEFVFAPRVPGAAPAPGQEDDGFLLTFVNDAARGGLAELVVIDAKTMSSEPVARVMMPCRVPYGFHATWVNEEQMQKQQH